MNNYLRRIAGRNRPWPNKGWGDSHPDAEIKGGSLKKIFSALGPQFGLKIRGAPGPSPGSVTAPISTGISTLCLRDVPLVCERWVARGGGEGSGRAGSFPFSRIACHAGFSESGIRCKFLMGKNLLKMTLRCYPYTLQPPRRNSYPEINTFFFPENFTFLNPT